MNGAALAVLLLVLGGCGLGVTYERHDKIEIDGRVKHAPPEPGDDDPEQSP